MSAVGASSQFGAAMDIRVSGGAGHVLRFTHF